MTSSCNLAFLHCGICYPIEIMLTMHFGFKIVHVDRSGHSSITHARSRESIKVIHRRAVWTIDSCGQSHWMQAILFYQSVLSCSIDFHPFSTQDGNVNGILLISGLWFKKQMHTFNLLTLILRCSQPDQEESYQEDSYFKSVGVVL